MAWIRKLGLFWALMGLLLAALVVASLDWRGAEDRSGPKVVASFAASGDLRAGAAKASLVPDFPAPFADFTGGGDLSFAGVIEPVHARAVVLEAGGKRIALVSVELAVVSAPLREKVIKSVADLHLDDVVIAATHTQSSIGGYWDGRFGPWLGLGAYDAKVEAFVVERVSTALHEAAAAMVPAKLGAASLEVSHFGLNRHGDKLPVDGVMTASRISNLAGDTIARLVIFGVHASIVDRDLRQLSPDWPGSLATAMEADGGVTLFWQGAGGDTTWGKRQGNLAPLDRAHKFGVAVAGDARGALAAGGEGEASVAIAHARVRVPLPKVDSSGSMPWILAPIVSNLVHAWIHPGTCEVSFTRVGPLAFAAVPAEPVSELGIAWRKQLGAAVVGLADAYLGYVETPANFHAAEGESVRSYFGPELGARLLAGLEAAKRVAVVPARMP